MRSLKFQSIIVEKLGKDFLVDLKTTSLNDINQNEVIIKVIYSAINFKDLLISEGNPGLVRRYPHTPGIDLAGIVEVTKSNKFKVGDYVIVVARPLGIEVPGGLAEFAKVPERWVEKVPDGITLKTAMIFGTAGFTGALAIYELENQKALSKGQEVLVTGVSGGVGLLSTYMLIQKGYKVSALIRKRGNSKKLKTLGVNNLVRLSDFERETKFPLSRPRYSAVIETLGGKFLSLSSRQLHDRGAAAVIGIASSNQSDISLLPLVLRGVKLIGINAEQTSLRMRKRIWEDIKKFSKYPLLEPLYTECSLKDVKDKLQLMKLQKHFGRFIVKIGM